MGAKRTVFAIAPLLTGISGALLVYYFISLLPVDLSVNFKLVAALLFFLLCVWSVWLTLRKSIRKREIDNNEKSRGGKRKGFYIEIDFGDDGTLTETPMPSVVKWGEKAKHKSEDSNPADAELGGVEALQSLLPRLASLQRIAGSDASIKVWKLDSKELNAAKLRAGVLEREKSDADAWQFTFQRGPGTTIGLGFIKLLCLSVALLLLSFLISIHSNAGVSIALAVGFALALMSVIICQHRLTLPVRLELNLEKRPNSKNTVFDMRWSSYHGLFMPMHDQWAILTFSSEVEIFCKYACQFGDENESTGFNDLELKKLASDDRQMRARKTALRRYSRRRGQFQLRSFA